MKRNTYDDDHDGYATNSQSSVSLLLLLRVRARARVILSTHFTLCSLDNNSISMVYQFFKVARNCQ